MYGKMYKNEASKDRPLSITFNLQQVFTVKEGNTNLPEGEPSRRVLEHFQLIDSESMIWPPACGPSCNSAEKFEYISCLRVLYKRFCTKITFHTNRMNLGHS